jgi:hypothetical protein
MVSRRDRRDTTPTPAQGEYRIFPLHNALPYEGEVDLVAP